MTAVVEGAVSAEQARTLTDRIKVSVEGVWHLITEAYTSRAWAALDYSSWDDYCTREFGASRLGLPREERAETVQSLRASGLSIPAIAAATGIGVGTVHRALTSAPFPNGKPEPDDVPLTQKQCEALAAQEPDAPIVGTDGKSYPPSRPRPPVSANVDTSTKVDNELPSPAPESDPIGDAKDAAMRRPAVVAGKTIERLEVVTLGLREFTADEAVADLPVGHEANAVGWLASLDIAIPLLESFRAGLRRRNLRSVQ